MLFYNNNLLKEGVKAVYKEETFLNLFIVLFVFFWRGAERGMSSSLESIFVAYTWVF